ncbi:MAG: hypothetical protein M1834_003652 [Cirrosporium novae-zelandiae]|nr:MAG: hypothetical protein M1834_003652 [Cirrosporium novae-zelandiae]
MREPKVQPLIPPIRRRLQILYPLLLRHSVPDPLPISITQDIINFRQKIYDDISTAESQECTVTLAIAGGIGFLVDVGRDDGSRLHAHIVEGRRDGARPDGIGVAGIPAGVDGVCAGVSEQSREDAPAEPFVDAVDVDDVDVDEEWEGPDLADQGCEG